MVEEVEALIFNIEPKQYEPIAMESDAATEDDSLRATNYMTSIKIE